ncbi:MAG TPA: hypothetical protein IGP91_01230 [Thermosynechococcus sp. M46_R2017_013]|nr:hypothetical protein [Thermosynechococcus sp. M46_R2017_013]
MGCRSLSRGHNTLIALAIASGLTLGTTLLTPPLGHCSTHVRPSKLL